MNSLDTLQKTFRVFKIISKVAMILSFVWAGLTVLGLLCGIAWYSGGSVIGASRETLQYLTAADSLDRMMGVLLSDLVFALTDGTLFFACVPVFQTGAGGRHALHPRGRGAGQAPGDPDHRAAARGGDFVRFVL